jgi:N-acetylmuramoyl-L-alanine amidase
VEGIVIIRDGNTKLPVTTVTLILVLAQFGGNNAAAALMQDDESCLALSIYWEARGEGRRGMVAVGWTILNRVEHDGFPSTPCAVVRQGGEQPPCQFSWWCDGRSDRPRDQKSWRMSQGIASELLSDPPPDPTNGSLFFHRTGVKPSWVRSRKKVARIGAHIFYR